MITDQIVGLTLRVEGKTSAILTVTFMVCTFSFWGVAGYWSVQKGRGIIDAMIAGGWSAIVTMTIVVAFGFLIEFYLATPKPEYVATWAEFKRSGWRDVGAFTTANTLESALTHLIIGPIVGAALGCVGGLVKVLKIRLTSNA